MATYYIRKTGSDAAAGTSAATAWLTIGKALGAAGAASGDTVYIGAGTYRETVVVAMTSATVETKFIGDVTGANTGDAGIVRWTAWTTDDKTLPANTILLSLAGRDFLTFQNISFYGAGGTAAVISSSTVGAATNITFTKCIFTNVISTGRLIDITATGAPQPTSLHWLIDSCHFYSFNGAISFHVNFTSSASGADWDLDIVIKNSLFINTSSLGCVKLLKSGVAAFMAGGIIIQNCTLLFEALGLQTTAASSTSIPCKIYNCVLAGSNAAALLSAGNTGEIIEDYNQLMGATPRTNVNAGGNSVVSYALLFNLGQAELWGFNSRVPFSPTVDSPQLGFGTDGSVSLTVDMLGRDRPSGSGITWANVSKAVGALEYHDFAAKESSVVVAGDAWKLTGPGDCDIRVPLDTTATVLAIQGRYDTNHGTGSKPQAELIAAPELGITGQTLTMSVGVDTWETLTFRSITSSSKAWVTVRLRSRAAAGNGLNYWDSLTAV